MSDVNEESFSTATVLENSAARRIKSLRERIPAPIWRARPMIPLKKLKTQIIPKIVFALRKMPTISGEKPAQSPTTVELFVALTLGSDDGAALAFVQDLITKGSSVESIFLDLLAPAARQLGAEWEADITDFVKVTLAVGRMQLIMRQFGDRFVDESRGTPVAESALLTVVPGEQHSFGLSMVGEFFRRAGWNLSTETFTSHQQLTSLVRRQWFDVVGFSVSSNRRLDELKQGIEDVRRDSRNKNVGIMIGGPMVIAHPDLVTTMGADMMSADATTAPQQAHELVGRMKEKH